MKFHYTITTAALALAGLALTPSAAKAGATAGDLILSFRYSDNTNVNDLEVDLGAASNFTTSATLNLTFGSNYYAGANAGGLSSADLDTVFGTTGGAWNALPKLVWDTSAKTGSSGSNVSVWATQTLGNVTLAASGTSLNTNAGGRIVTMDNGFNPTVGLTSPTAGQITATLSSQNNYTGALRGSPTTSIDFAFFTKSTETGVSSTGNVSLELFNYGNNTRTDLGTLTLAPDGGLTFNGVSAAPEPTTFGLLGIASVGLLGLRRRRTVAQA